jgi:glycosyltransferase involved in cell wall biosynthesis
LYFLCHLRRAVGFRLAFVCALDAEIDGDFRRENPARGYFFDRGMRLADIRMAITEHQAALFRARGMPCSVTRLLLQERTFHEGSKSVDLLWVARCHPVKRPHLFLDLAERLPQARCRMICSVQDRTLWNEVSARAAELPHVEFLESAPYREIQNHFNAARIFVNTSSHEGVPNTFIQSGLGGTAIVSLAIDPDGMFQHFAAGFCARGDFEAFAGAAGELLGSPQALGSAQRECARFVREWHDNATNLAAFLAAVQA